MEPLVWVTSVFLDSEIQIETSDPTECVNHCNPPSYELISPTLSDEKLQQLTEQHNRYIKAEVDGYVRPSFLCTPENESPSTASGTAATVSSKKKCCCSVCDGKGHVQPGKKKTIFLRSIAW